MRIDGGWICLARDGDMKNGPLLLAQGTVSEDAGCSHFLSVTVIKTL